MSNETKWAWEGGDRFSIGDRMYGGAEVAELLDRYEQQDRMKTREINLIVPENKALEAKAKLADGLREHFDPEHGEMCDGICEFLDAYDALSPIEEKK